MTEPFKAPPIPQAPAPGFQPAQNNTPNTSFQPQQQPIAQPDVLPETESESQATAPETEPGFYDDNFAADFNLPPSVLKTKSMTVILIATCLIGVILGSMLFGSSSAPKQQNTGLQGVVRNQDITTATPRCGLTDRGEACILYIVNHTRYDKIAEEFFDEAVKLTEVQKYSIAIANPKYAKTRIPPGYFAQIKIPKVR